jgi:hypothetical protein
MIYISSSWKQRERVRKLAIELREHGYSVYDFTDPSCRSTPEIPPEKFPEPFDPDKHDYEAYLCKNPEWRAAVDCNREALDHTNMVVLLLPCGLDAHADAYYALGRGARLIISGAPVAGERAPVHLWASMMVATDDRVLDAVRQVAAWSGPIAESFIWK